MLHYFSTKQVKLIAKKLKTTNNLGQWEYCPYISTSPKVPKTHSQTRSFYKIEKNTSPITPNLSSQSVAEPGG